MAKQSTIVSGGMGQPVLVTNDGSKRTTIVNTQAIVQPSAAKPTFKAVVIA